MTNNELIAQFMGGKDRKSVSPGIGQTMRANEIWLPFYGIKSLDHLRYDTSWDWLMRVVEKINTIDREAYNVRIDGNQTIIDCYGTHEDCCFESSNGNTLENTYSAVIEFIKFYNTCQPTL